MGSFFSPESNALDDNELTDLSREIEKIKSSLTKRLEDMEKLDENYELCLNENVLTATNYFGELIGKEKVSFYLIF